jgi:membrane-associated phospholipid phosphatase
MRKSLYSIFVSNRSFLLPYLFFVILAYVIQVSVSKPALFLWVNGHHSEFLDAFFPIYTMIGDGFAMSLVTIGLLFVRYRYSIITASAYLFTSVMAQILKRINPIRTIQDYPIYEWNSFPSGHSVSAFALATVLTYMLPFRYRGYVILPFALLAAFSRVYLSQHFFQDVVAGSILGVMLTFILIWMFENSKWYHSDKLNGSLLRRPNNVE